jgi:putative PIN family toxin of toxin-antitoxin system
MSVPRLVVDVNVIIGSLIGSPRGLAAQLHLHMRQQQVRYVISHALLDEIARVCGYRAIMARQMTPSVAFQLAIHLFDLSEIVLPVPALDWPSLSDRKDWYLLDLLYESAADALVTQDKTLLKAAQSLGMPTLLLEELPERSWFGKKI